MTTFQNIPHDVFITHIIPHMLNKYILKIQQENELLLNMFHIFNLICSSKYYSQFDNNKFWINIMLLIFPKNYTITEKSQHIVNKNYFYCSRNWIYSQFEQGNLFWNLSLSQRHNLWIDAGSPCGCINHYDINTLKSNEKYNIKENRNFKKIMMVKLRSCIEKNYIISKTDINKLQKLNYRIQLNNISNPKILTLRNNLQTKYDDKNSKLLRLNHSIGGSKDKKFNSFINFINSNKNKPDYYFDKYKKLWKNMTQTEKNLYKTI